MYSEFEDVINFYGKGKCSVLLEHHSNFIPAWSECSDTVMMGVLSQVLSKTIMRSKWYPRQLKFMLFWLKNHRRKLDLNGEKHTFENFKQKCMRAECNKRIRTSQDTRIHTLYFGYFTNIMGLFQDSQDSVSSGVNKISKFLFFLIITYLIIVPTHKNKRTLRSLPP